MVALGSRARSTSCAGCRPRSRDAALVNAVVTATEAKTQALLEAGVPGTGTASDAVGGVLPAAAAPSRTAVPAPSGAPASARAVHGAVARRHRAGTVAAWRRDHPRARRGPLGQVGGGRAAGRADRAGPVTYVATAGRRRRRCRPRRARRPPTELGATRRWTTVEAGADLPAVAARDGRAPCSSTRSAPGSPATPTWRPTPPALVRGALRRRTGDTVVVSEEVGLGVHPSSELGRRFRDALGAVNRGGGRRGRRGAARGGRSGRSRWSDHEARARLPHAARRRGRAGRPHALVVPGRRRADRRGRGRRLVGRRRSSGRRRWRPRSWSPSTSRSPGCCTSTGWPTAPTACCPRSRASAGWRSWPSPTVGAYGVAVVGVVLAAALRGARVDGRRRAAGRRHLVRRPARRWRSPPGPLPYARAEGGPGHRVRSVATGARSAWPGSIVAASLGAVAAGRRQSGLAVAARLAAGAGVVGASPAAGSAGSPATCSVPPAWSARRWRSSWRRRRGDARDRRSGVGRSGSWPTALLGEPPATRAPGRRVRPGDAVGRGAARTRDRPAPPGCVARGGRRRPSASLAGRAGALDRGRPRASAVAGRSLGEAADRRRRRARRRRPRAGPRAAAGARRARPVRARRQGDRPGRRRVGGREHRRRRRGPGAVGRGRRRARRARPPGGQHDGRHGRPPQRALRAASAGPPPASTTSPPGCRPGPPPCSSPRAVRTRRPRVLAHGAARRARPTRRRTAGWPRRPSPPPSGCGSVARAATATASRCARRSATAGRPEPSDIAARRAPQPRRRPRAGRRPRHATSSRWSAGGGRAADEATAVIPAAGRPRRRRRRAWRGRSGSTRRRPRPVGVAQPVRARRGGRGRPPPRRRRALPGPCATPPRRWPRRWASTRTGSCSPTAAARRSRSWPPALGGTVAAEPEFSLHPARPTGPRWRSNPHNPTGRAGRRRPRRRTCGTRRSTRWPPARGPEATRAPWSSARSRRSSPAPGSASATCWPTTSAALTAAPAGVAGRTGSAWPCCPSCWPAPTSPAGATRSPCAAASSSTLLAAHELDGRRRRRPVGARRGARPARPAGAPRHRRARLRELRPARTRAHRRARRPRPGPAAGGAPVRGALMVCGTGSDVGKSHVVAGLCRAAAPARRAGGAVQGARTCRSTPSSPPSGHEIGRAQADPGLRRRARARGRHEPDPAQADAARPRARWW